MSSSYCPANLSTILDNFSSEKRIQVLPHGVMVIKNCLDENQQLAILQTCMKIANEPCNVNLLPREPYKRESKRAIPILFYNWTWLPQTSKIERPSEMLDFAHRLFSAASQYSHEMIAKHNIDISDPNHKCPTQFDPSGVYAIMYPHGGKFSAHLDGAQGWVMSISIGESAKFFWSTTKEGQREYLQLDSGDVCLFNGGKLYHGVDEIIPNSAPAFWTRPECPVSVFDMGRFSLQFRDPIADRLTYNPYFYVDGEQR